MMEDKILPHSENMEQSVLGMIFLDPMIVQSIADKLSVHDFYFKRHQLIYDVILSLFQNGSKIDYLTVINQLSTQELLASAGGEDYIFQLADTATSTANLDYYINIVKDKAVIRNMIYTAKKITEDGYKADNMAEYIDEAEKQVFHVASSRRTSEFLSIKSIADNVIEKTEAAKKNTGLLTGLDTGFNDINEYTLGLQKEELYIIAGRPSMGKSAFALNIAMNVCKNDPSKHVAIFSLEMGVEQLVGRMLSAEAHVQSTKIRTGDLSPGEWEQLSLASSKLSKHRILFDDSGTVKITDLRQKCRKLSQEGKLDLVIIDYLQLLSASNPNPNRVQEVSEISRTLKEMARELKIPVIALSQLSRRVESRPDKTPIMADLRESGSIEQDADVVIFLYRDDYYNQNSPYPDQVDVIISKNRSGATTGEPIHLLFKRSYSSFKNLRFPSQEKEGYPDVS